MSVRSAQSVTVDFTTRRFDTGVAVNADSTPTGTLVLNGTDNAASVTVTNVATGIYKAAVTLPTLAVNDIVEIRIAATVNSVSDNGVIWRDTKDVFAGAIPDVAAAAAGGLFIAGSNAATTVNFTGNLSGSVGSVTGAVGSVTGNVGGNVTGSVGSISGITFPTNFAALSISASGLVDITQTAADKVWSTTTRVLTAGTNIQLPSNGLSNVTAWTVNLTGNLSGSVGSVTGNVGGNVVGSVGSVTGNVGGNVVGSVGSISGITFPSNFSALGINASGHILRTVLNDTTTTLTNLPAITTDWITAAGVSAAAVTKIQNGLGTSANQATIISGLAAINADTDAIQVVLANNLDVAVSTRMATFTYTAPDNATIVLIRRAVYDSATVSGGVITLSNGATQTVSAAGRVLAGP